MYSVLRLFFWFVLIGSLIGGCGKDGNENHELDASPGSDTDTDTDTDADTDTGTDTDTGSDSDSDTESDSDPDTDADSGTDTDIDSVTDTDSDSDAKSDSDPDTDADTGTGTGTDTDTGSDSDSGSDTESDSDSDTDTDSGADTDADSDADTDSDSDTESDSDPDTNADSGSDTDTDTDADSDTDTDEECPEGWTGPDCDRCLVYVNQSTGNDGNDGRSWANALASVPRGLLIANYYVGCEVWVAQGIYYPTEGTDRAVSIQLVSGVDLYGGFAGGETLRSQRDWTAHVTTLSGDIERFYTSRDSYHVVKGADDAILDGFTISGGQADGYSPDNRGAGMYNDAVSPTVTNCIFSNSASYDGGGMYNRSASPTLVNCTFGNHSTHGGDMYNDHASPTITNCTFSGHATEGGAIYNSFSSPEIIGCTFSSNLAYVGGAILNADFAAPIISGCTFTSNLAYMFGGAIANSASAAPTISDCTFSDNTANHMGGAIYNAASSTSIADSVFNSNIALYTPYQTSSAVYGGAIYNAASSSLEIVGCTFDGNRAYNHDSSSDYSSYGGAIYSASSSSTTIRNSIFKNNNVDIYASIISSETSDGGALYLESGATIALTSCTFQNNTAENDGGGIYNASAALTLTGGSFISNRATNGGGIYTASAAPVITQCEFAHNTASSSGGAIYGNPTSIVDSVFNGNRSFVSGGAVCYSTSTPKTINACTFSGNASVSGGAIYVEKGWPTITVANSVIYGNSRDEIAKNSADIAATYSDIKGGGYAGTGNINSNPLFVNSPLETTFASATGTTTKVIIAYATTLVFNNYIIEIGDDSVARTVTGIVNDALTFTPALSEAAPVETRVDIWGTGVTNLNVDLHLQSSSPCANTGNTASLPADTTDLDSDGNKAEAIPYDLDGHPRVVGASVDMGAYEVQ